MFRPDLRIGCCLRKFQSFGSEVDHKAVVISVRIKDRTEVETRRKSCIKVDLTSRWSLIEGIAVGRDSGAKRCRWSEMSLRVVRFQMFCPNEKRDRVKPRWIMLFGLLSSLSWALYSSCAIHYQIGLHGLLKKTRDIWAFVVFIYICNKREKPLESLLHTRIEHHLARDNRRRRSLVTFLARVGVRRRSFSILSFLYLLLFISFVTCNCIKPEVYSR